MNKNTCYWKQRHMVVVRAEPRNVFGSHSVAAATSPGHQHSERIWPRLWTPAPMRLKLLCNPLATSTHPLCIAQATNRHKSQPPFVLGRLGGLGHFLGRARICSLQVLPRFHL